MSDEIGSKLDTVKTQIHDQFGEILDSGVGSLKTTIAGAVAAFMVLQERLMDGAVLPENMSDIKNIVYAGALLALGVYSRTK